MAVQYRTGDTRGTPLCRRWPFEKRWHPEPQPAFVRLSSRAPMKSLQLAWGIVVLACSATCGPDAASISGASKTPVVAETGSGLRAMQPVGVLQRTGDSLLLLLTEKAGTAEHQTAWGDLPQVARVFGMLVNGSEDARHMRVWLWRSGNPAERIDVTGEITPAAVSDRYRIRFKDVSTDETFQSWANGDARNPPLKLILHRHDSGFAIDVASDQAATSHLVIGCGAPGSRVYAARFGRP